MTTEPIGFARDLPVQRVMRAVIGDTDLAIWRSRSGKLAAWGNRCPHRGMRLSHGFVRGESLACLYHGWHYGSAGGCTYIPAHPDLDPPKTIRAEIYSIAEQGGVLWVSVDGEVDASALAENLMPVRSLTLECDAPTAVAAFLGTPMAGDARQLSDGHVSRDNPDMLVFDGPDPVVILLQRNPDRTVTAHILADKAWPGRGLIALSRWAEAARRAGESHATDDTDDTEGDGRRMGS